jgi:hypothetical protein
LISIPVTYNCKVSGSSETKTGINSTSVPVTIAITVEIPTAIAKHPDLGPPIPIPISHQGLVTSKAKTGDTHVNRAPVPAAITVIKVPPPVTKHPDLGLSITVYVTRNRALVS